MLDKGPFSSRPGNTNLEFGQRSRHACRICTAGSDRGTRCSRCPFKRSAGTVHVRPSRSISGQSAPITSPVRAAVSNVNSRANRTASVLGASRSCFTNAGISRQGMAGWCFVRRACFGRPPRTAWAAFTARARTVPCGGRPVEHHADALADPSRGLRLGGPDWREHLQHVRRLDVANRHLANGREGIGPQRRNPLRAVLGVAPESFPFGMDLFGSRLETEADALGRTTLLRRVMSGATAPSHRCGLVACLS